MEIISGARGTGKTTKLLEMAAKDPNSVIVCRSPERLKEKAYSLGIIGLDFIDYKQYLTGILNGSFGSSVYIDEPLNMLKSVIGEVKGITLTTEG